MAYLSDEERATLVAYLDGELDEQAAQALEARLSSDPRARAEADGLRRTWELLDYLPRAEASTSFTHRTLERLAVQTSSRPRARPGVRSGWLLLTGWVAALLLAFAAGLGAANLLWPRPSELQEEPADLEAQRRRELRVLENERLHEDVNDLKFLRELDQPGLFGDDVKGDLATPRHLVDIVFLRYTDWLDRLTDRERQSIAEAAERQIRLKRIGEIRDERWLRRQPLALRHKLDGLRPALRMLGAAQLALSRPPRSAALAFANDLPSFLIGGLQRAERRRRQEWHIALKHWDELKEGRQVRARLSDFDKGTEVYIKEYLYPRLSRAEKKDLEKAEGHWPQYPYTLVKLADRWPPALPSLHGPTSFKELPQELQIRLKKSATKGPKGEFFLNRVKAFEGKWPGFAYAVTAFAARRNLHMPHELWPSHPRDLSPAVHDFLYGTLWKKLEAAEKKLLKEKEGKWPDYPKTIQEFARRHSLQVPWQTLPVGRENWDAYRFKRQANTGGLRGTAPAESACRRRGAAACPPDPATNLAACQSLPPRYTSRQTS